MHTDNSLKHNKTALKYTDFIPHSNTILADLIQMYCMRNTMIYNIAIDDLHNAFYGAIYGNKRKKG